MRTVLCPLCRRNKLTQPLDAWQFYCTYCRAIFDLVEDNPEKELRSKLNKEVVSMYQHHIKKLVIQGYLFDCQGGDN